MLYKYEEGSLYLLRNASTGASIDAKFDTNAIVWPFLIQVSSNDRAKVT